MFLPRLFTPFLSIKAERDRLRKEWLRQFEALECLDESAKSSMRPIVETWANTFAPLQALWTYIALSCAFVVLSAYATVGLFQVILVIPLPKDYRALVFGMNGAYLPTLVVGYGLLWLVMHIQEIRSNGKLPEAAIGIYLLNALYLLNAQRNQSLSSTVKRTVVSLIEVAATALEKHMARFLIEADFTFRAEVRNRFKMVAAGLRELRIVVLFPGSHESDPKDRLAQIFSAWALMRWADLPSTTPRSLTWPERHPILYKLWIGLCACGLVVGAMGLFKSTLFPAQPLLVLPILVTALFDKRTGDALKMILDVLERVRGLRQ